MLQNFVSSMNVVKFYFFFQAFTSKVQSFEKNLDPSLSNSTLFIEKFSCESLCKDSPKPPTYPSKE